MKGWMRIVFCLDPVTLPFEGALEAALCLQKEQGSTARPEASRLLAQMRGK